MRLADQIKIMLQDADICTYDSGIQGSVIYHDTGLKLRRLIYDLFIKELEMNGFGQLLLPDVLHGDDVRKLDAISPISHQYLPIRGTEYVMAAGHEVPFYLYLKQYLKSKTGINDPLKFYQFGSVYRFPKSGPFPFALGERRHFLECFSVHSDSNEEYSAAFELCANMVRNFIFGALSLPGVEVVRPSITNKPFSELTQCIDVITLAGQTVITGMVYSHDRIFSKALHVTYRQKNSKKRLKPRVVHFGVSDNTFYNVLLHAYTEGGFRFLSSITPVHILLLEEDGIPDAKPFQDFLASLDSVGLRYKRVKKMKSEASIHQANLQGIIFIVKCSVVDNDLSISMLQKGKWQRSEDAARPEYFLNKIGEYDAALREKSSERLNQSLQTCATIIELNQGLLQGRVCKVFLQNDDASVLALEKMIAAGEVLGFQKISQQGADIVSGARVSTVAFVSRRV